MTGISLSPESDHFKGPSFKKTIVLCAGLILLLGAGLLLVALSLNTNFRWWVFAACFIGQICAGFALLFWFRWYARGYAAQLEKAQVGIRRAQNKSNYFEGILQNSTDIIFTVDIEGYILKFNKGAELHLGYTQSEIVGVPFKTLFVNEADERKILDMVLLTGKSANAEISLKTVVGEVILVNISVAEMKSESGQIVGLVVTAKDITEKKKLELELIKTNKLLGLLAITDSLTGLYNARHFYDQLKKEFVRLRRNLDRKFSLVLMDIDHFKEFNDTEGHQMGDQVLKGLGEVINVCIRKDIDMGFRYGGDEFTILLPDTDKQSAQVVARRIQKQFGAFRFGRTSLSVGIAEARADEDEKILVNKADEAMYQSKHEGRARITVHD
ncbi:MAG: sensor domain-containing diguanylate cyclase [Chitinivibrionales bacterium]|nr:sensor domain-containing diguanylate cyclase [Chitinivibrionales bacterium]